MNETLPERIANSLRRDILRGRLELGATLKERDLAAEMEVSRTPTREAIRILAQEGLVILRPSRSPVVADPSWKQTRASMEVLYALELLSGELACAYANEDDINRIAAIQARMEAEESVKDDIDLFEIDMEFHIAIAQASHNETLADMHRTLLARMWRVRFLGSRSGRNQERVFRQHNAIIAGLRDRDAVRVQKEIREHLDILIAQIHRFFDTGDGSAERSLRENPLSNTAAE